MGSERCKTVRLQYVVIKKFGKKDLLVREESELSASNVPIVAPSAASLGSHAGSG